MNFFHGLAIAGNIAAQLTTPGGGGFINCQPQLGCIGQAYVRPPIVRPYWPLPPLARSQLRLWPGERDPRYWPGEGPPPSWPPSVPYSMPPLHNRLPPIAAAPPPAYPPPADQTEAAAIQADILNWCDQHPSEAFCGRVQSYLQRHSEADPRASKTEGR